MSNNDWLELDVLEDYLDGKLDAKTNYKIERLTLEDPFVAEALAGLSYTLKRRQVLSLLQKQLHNRIVQKPITQKRWSITSLRLSIAATAAVLFITVAIVFWMKENNRWQLATSKKVEVLITPSVTENSAAITTPLGGWVNLQRYLGANNKLQNGKAKGKFVTLNFKVKKDGRPTQITVKNSLGKIYDDEAIRLLNLGPNWLTTPSQKSIVSLKIQF